MPLPDPTGWAPQQLLNGMQSTAAPPPYIQNELARIGTPWDPSKYGWDPMSMSLIDRSTGSRYSYANIADPSLGTDVVTNLTNYNTYGRPADYTTPDASGNFSFPEGVNPYIAFPGDSYNAGLLPNSGYFISADPAEIDAYKDAARTRSLQGVAQIGALVGGGALASNLLGPSAAAGAPATGAATTYPLAATGGAITATPIAAGAGAGAAASGGAAAGGAAAGALPGATGAVGNALSNVPAWLDYALPAINALVGGAAAGRASDAEVAALQAGIDEQRRQFDTTRADLAPWLTAGQGALGRLQDPTTNFMVSPDYGFRRSEGIRDTGNTFAARGMGQSGNALRALTEYNSNLASGEFNDWWNRQSNLAGIGQTTGSTLGQLGANQAANTGNLLAGQGQSRASGVLGKYGALANAGQNIYENYLYRRRAA